MGNVLVSQTVSASNSLALRLDELQFDLGEGPCWDALVTRKPVLQPDLTGEGFRAWPLFSASLHEEPVTGVFAFPLLLGPLQVGAIDVYTHGGQQLLGAVARALQACTTEMARLVLKHAVSDDGQDSDTDLAGLSRRVVHQATGAVTAQIRVSPEDAYLIIQGKALADGMTMQETAEAILERRITFRMGDDGIEDSP